MKKSKSANGQILIGHSCCLVICGFGMDILEHGINSGGMMPSNSNNKLHLEENDANLTFFSETKDKVKPGTVISVTT